MFKSVSKAIVHVLLAWMFATDCASSSFAAPPTGNTGPGGFEATDVPVGATGLEYWLRADVPSSMGTQTLFGDQAVNSWTSQTLSAQAFTQSVDNKKPRITGSLTTIGGNSLPAVFFDRSTSTTFSDSLTTGSSSTVGTVVIVNAPLVAGSTSGIWGQAGSVAGNEKGIRMAPNANDARWQTSGNFTGAPQNDNFAGPTGSSTYVNGADVTATGAFPGTYPTPTGQTPQPHILSALRGGTVQNPLTLAGTSIGEYFTSIHRAYSGSIGEIVAYDRTLNLAERQIVENALSSKYDIAISGDVYIGDTSGNGNFDQGVFGIGRVSAGNALAAAGQSGLGFEATAGLEDGDYLLAGNRTAVNSYVETLTMARSLRSWFVDGTGLDGNEALTIAFDLSDAGLGAPPLNAGAPQLIFSPNDPTFATFTTFAENPTVVGDTYLFSVAGASLGQLNANGYLTFAFSTAVPEPKAMMIWMLGATLSLAVVLRRRFPLSSSLKTAPR